MCVGSTPGSTSHDRSLRSPPLGGQAVTARTSDLARLKSYPPPGIRCRSCSAWASTAATFRHPCHPHSRGDPAIQMEDSVVVRVCVQVPAGRAHTGVPEAVPHRRHRHAAAPSQLHPRGKGRRPRGAAPWWEDLATRVPPLLYINECRGAGASGRRLRRHRAASRPPRRPAYGTWSRATALRLVASPRRS